MVTCGCARSRRISDGRAREGEGADATSEWPSASISATCSSGSPETVHVQLVRANPQVTMHLPDLWKAVVVQGEVRVSKPSPELAQRLADLANDKYAEYGIKFEASSYSEPGCCTRGG